MQQRQLRLGDILDDYCPRERRVTNHVIVAMVDQEVKQTRCTTCDADHEYKQAKVPPQRKKKPAQGALYQEVLAGMPRKTPAPVVAAPDPPGDPGEDVSPVAEPAEAAAAADDPPVPLATSEAGDELDGPVHRPLIRATLPRPEGQVPTRQAPEFTIRQPLGKPGRFRPAPGHRDRGAMPGSANGHPGGSFRFGRGRGTGVAQAGQPGQGNRTRSVHGERQAPHRRRGGKKRSK